MQRELVYLLDMLQSAQMIQAYINALDQTAFEADLKTQDAVIRRIEIIGVWLLCVLTSCRHTSQHEFLRHNIRMN